jgi:hypothetical protein
MAEKSRIVLFKEFFGMKQGQTLQEFSNEVKELSEPEKVELAALICAQTGDTLKGV